MSLDTSCEKYKTKIKYPSTEHYIIKPKLGDYHTNESYGKALDVYENKISNFKKRREQLLTSYRNDENRLMQLFWDDLFDEMDWNDMDDKQKSVIRIYLWDRGHAYGYTEVLNEAWAIEELIGSFL